MIVLKVLVVILLAVGLLLLVPIGVDVGYCEEELNIYFRFGPVTIRIYPSKRTSKSGKTSWKKWKTKGAKRKSGKEKNHPNLTKDEVLDAVSVAVQSFRKLRFHLHRLKLHFISAFEDPYQTAMVYGYTNAAVYGLGLSRLKQGDIQLAVDFQREKYYLDGYLSVTIKIYYIMKLVCCLIGGMVPILWRRRKRTKAEKHSAAMKGMEA